MKCKEKHAYTIQDFSHVLTKPLSQVSIKQRRCFFTCSITLRIVQPCSRRSFSIIQVYIVIIRQLHLCFLISIVLCVCSLVLVLHKNPLLVVFSVSSQRLDMRWKTHINNWLLLLCRLIILGTSFSSDLAWESLTILLQNVSISMAQHIMCYLSHI